MQVPEAFQNYIDAVCQHIRWKNAYPIVAREIEDHMYDQCDSLINSGMAEEDAINETVRQMGDSSEVGKLLNEVHRPKVAYEIFVIVAIMLIEGWALNSYFTEVGAFLWRPEDGILVLATGLLVTAVAYWESATFIERFPILVLITFFVAAFLCLIIPQMNFYFQYLSILFPISISTCLYRLKAKGLLALWLTWSMTVIFSIFCFLCGSIFGIVLSVFATLLLTFIATKDGWLGIPRRKKIRVICAEIIAVGSAMILLCSLYAPLSQRLIIAINPSLDPAGIGYQSTVVRELIYKAEFWGNIASEIEFMGVNSDFILTWLICKFGWSAFFVIIIVTGGLLVCSFVRGIKQRSFLGRSISLAVIVSLSLQALFYVLTNLGLDLVRSISLPMISYGGTGTVLNMFLIGLMLSAFRYGSVISDAIPMYKQYTIGSVFRKSHRNKSDFNSSLFE